jgi:hypothetical protein
VLAENRQKVVLRDEAKLDDKPRERSVLLLLETSDPL